MRLLIDMSNSVRPRMKSTLYLAYDREMDSVKISKGKKLGLIVKTWERCKSFGHGGRGAGEHKSNPAGILVMRKSKSWPGGVEVEVEGDEEKRGVRKPRIGCFSLYVGPQKQRFVIKTEYINHPLFKVLLEEAELEYGYNSGGPLALPCKVDIFLKVLLKIGHSHHNIQGPTHRSYLPLTSSSPMIYMI